MYLPSPYVRLKSPEESISFGRWFFFFVKWVQQSEEGKRDSYREALENLRAQNICSTVWNTDEERSKNYSKYLSVLLAICNQTALQAKRCSLYYQLRDMGTTHTKMFNQKLFQKSKAKLTVQCYEESLHFKSTEINRFKLDLVCIGLLGYTSEIHNKSPNSLSSQPGSSCVFV